MNLNFIKLINFYEKKNIAMNLDFDSNESVFKRKQFSSIHYNS